MTNFKELTSTEQASKDLYDLLVRHGYPASSMLEQIERMVNSPEWMMALAQISVRYGGASINEIIKNLKELVATSPQGQVKQEILL